MARRTIPEFSGTPELTDDIVINIKAFYRVSRENEDVATEPETNAYYEGQADALEWVLMMLFKVKE